VDAGSLDGAVAAFHALHRQLYGHAFDDVAVEIVNLRVKGLAGGPQPDMWWDWARTVDRLDAVRRVHVGDGIVDAAIAMRGDIAAGDQVEGPAVIHQVDSTILVPPGFTAEALPGGSLLLIDAAAAGARPDAAHAEVSL
jgi:N-methylhydantoinase A